MIDMHAHWRPAPVAEAMRSRTKEPRIVKNPDGSEMVKSRMGDEPVSEAFDNAESYVAQMDRQGVKVSVLSLLGQYCWVESQPLETSIHLCRLVNDDFLDHLPEVSRPLRRLRRAAAGGHPAPPRTSSSAR